MKDWETKPRAVRKQVGNGDLIPTDIVMSIAQFREAYANYETGATTICDPMDLHWIAAIDKYTNLWITAGEYEVYPERREARERASGRG
jgi:hypothetical protein